jgi:hypothetical protein
MVSSTQQSERIRHRKATRAGKEGKRARRLHSTPAFPIHLTDAATEAKPAEAKPAETKPAEKTAAKKK